MHSSIVIFLVFTFFSTVVLCLNREQQIIDQETSRKCPIVINEACNQCYNRNENLQCHRGRRCPNGQICCYHPCCNTGCQADPSYNNKNYNNRPNNNMNMGGNPFGSLMGGGGNPLTSLMGGGGGGNSLGGALGNLGNIGDLMNGGGRRR